MKLFRKKPPAAYWADEFEVTFRRIVDGESVGGNKMIPVLLPENTGSHEDAGEILKNALAEDGHEIWVLSVALSGRLVLIGGKNA